MSNKLRKFAVRYVLSATGRGRVMGENGSAKWYVMRDLKRRNSLTPAYLQLAEEGYDVFTPMRWVVHTTGGKRKRRQEPVISDLLFVHAEKTRLDVTVRRTPTLQYRYRTGHSANDPMVVRDADMERFIAAVRLSDSVNYYSPDEIGPAMCGRRVEIVGGPLNGFSGRLLSLRGSKRRRLLVEIPGLITAAVEVEPDYIRISEESDTGR